MLIKNNSRIRKVTNSLVNLFTLIILATAEIWGQMPKVSVPSSVPEATEDFTWQYIILTGLFIALIGTIIWVIKSKKKQKMLAASSKHKTNGDVSWERDSLDADKEMEWLRKNPNLVGKKEKENSGQENFHKNLAANQQSSQT